MHDFNYLIPRSYRTDFKVASRGEGIYIFDEKGTPYIDGCSGALLSNIGHGNRAVIDAMTRQLENIEFAHPSRWMCPVVLEAAEEIAAITPGDIKNVWLVSGGSEAVESAIKFSRQYFVERDGVQSSKYIVIGRWNSYHGSTLGTMAVGGSMPRRRIFSPLFKEFPKIQPHYCYRCSYGQTYPSCGVMCARELETSIKRIGPQYVAAFIAEPVVGSTVGALNPPTEYWPIIREICTRYDVLLIADEIMTGIGRTGKAFGVDNWGVVPDIICSAKAMSGGYSPVGGMFVRKPLAETLKNGSGSFTHGHTYNGNPVTAAAVSATLRFIRENNLFEKAAILGSHLGNRMEALLENPIVGEVRGIGLMRGIELVRDKKTREPFEPSMKAAQKLTQECMTRGLVVYPGTGQADGISGDQFMVAPPLVIERGEIDELVSRLDEALKATAKILLPQ
ncbi:MAG: aminotransferase class III-fold pyridoxal phosphate-dependent enzyme [Thermovirgaceae bacterium]|nr:aminotransferase class III-fold pyridoxal phosphate-dependent enzyme [Thermovirgaceae bacterium]